MNVACFGYRPWAINIFKRLMHWESHASWKILKEAEGIEKADVYLFYGWSQMITKKIYENKLCFILHPSPLPKYRGGSPLQHQIMAGEKMSAVTILKVGEKLDAGDIYSQTAFSLDGTLGQIFKRIEEIGTRETVRLLDDIQKNKAAYFKQVESQASTFKRRKPEESELKLEDFKNKTAEELYNFIRALADPYPNAFIKCKDGKKLYFTGTHL